jgi:hypothetical protein
MTIQYFDWPILDRQPTPAELEKIYTDGVPGAPYDEAEDESLFGDGLIETFSDACSHLRGFHNRDDRKVVPLFLSLVEIERRLGLPMLFGAENQPYGNCVSRGSQHARAVTNAVEIVIKGEPETYERPAWESTYRGRGHGGHGMNPAIAARVDVQQGFLWRRKYQFADLATQNATWGRGTGYPAAVATEMAKHKVNRWIRPETGDEALDLFAAGYACHSGQNIGFASRPNSQGYHPVSGRWNHDMASVGYDCSREVWPVDVVFVPNSWGDFNSQPEDKFRQRNWPRIPGMIVVRLEDWVRLFVGAKSIFFYADIQGVPAKNLPDWGSRNYL